MEVLPRVEARARFLDLHPEYAGTAALDALRASEHGRFDAAGHVDLDFAGASLHAESQVREHARLPGTEITLPRFLEVVQRRGGKSAGAIRVSLGIASNFADVERFLAFAAGFRDRTAGGVGTAKFEVESCRIIRDGS